MEIVKIVSNIYKKIVKITAQNNFYTGWGATKHYEKENNDCTVFDGYDNHYRSQFMHRPS